MAVFDLPPEYYRLLRIVVFPGAIIVLVKNIGYNHSRVLVFTLIAILFNPIYPFYLYQKVKWIPIDIVSGFLFLINGFYQKKINQEPVRKIKTKRKTHDRDRIL
jgi:general stress protein CsbA